MGVEADGGGGGGAVALDMDLTRFSKSVREVGEVSISRISCSMPCCNWRAKSSSVRSTSRSSNGPVAVVFVVVEVEGRGAVEVEVEVGGGTVVLAASPESKSSRISTCQYMVKEIEGGAEERGEGGDHLDHLGRRVLVVLPCLTMGCWCPEFWTHFELKFQLQRFRYSGPARIGGASTDLNLQNRGNSISQTGLIDQSILSLPSMRYVVD